MPLRTAVSHVWCGIAVRSILFAAVGTAGQRCTTLRRLLIHEKVYDQVLSGLVDAYGKVSPLVSLPHVLLILYLSLGSAFFFLHQSVMVSFSLLVPSMI